MMGIGSRYMEFKMKIQAEFNDNVEKVMMEHIEKEVVFKNEIFYDVKIKMNKEWVTQALLEKLARDLEKERREEIV